MTQQVYISDTNIWIDLRHAGLLETLFDLPFTFCCTDFVVAELEDFDQQALQAQGLLVSTLDSADTQRLFTLMSEHNNSSLADVSCYLLAKDTGHPLLTGDGRLRKQALGDGLTVYGALWLLDQMVAHKVITAAKAAQALEKMLQAGARLPANECQHRITAWKK
jgi:predicted nucleic acid-binding protein